MKNYLQLLGCLMLLLCSQVLWGQQIDFTLRYNLANNEYEVYGKPDFSDPAFFVGGGSQVSIVLPEAVSNAPLAITSVNGGSWFDNSQIYAPAADAVHDFHGIASNGSPMAWVSGQETLLFTFTFTGGTCLPGIRLFENASDPQDTDAGMAGGDFNNYFADAFTFANRYNANYDNAGTNCDPPLIIPIPLTIPQDSTGTVCMPITDVNIGDTFTANICTATPTNGTATPTVMGNTLCLEYIPTAGFSGTDEVCIIVCDQTGLCDTTSVPITVVPPLPPTTTPEPPIVIPSPLTTLEDSTSTVCMPILDSNVGDTFTANICTGSPANGTATPTIVGTTLCMEYTPNMGYTGDDPVCVIICDQTGLCDTITVPVYVIPVPEPTDSIQPPVVILPPIVTPIDSTIVVCGVVVDPNLNDIFSAAICQQPSNGTATVSIDNNTDEVCLTFDPNDGFVGTDSVCVIVCDQTGLCDSVQVPITVISTIWILNLKLMLQGAMFSTNDGLMRDDLRQQNLIPLQQPYSSSLATRFTHVGGGSETTTNAILNANPGTADAIVDWVFVEFRDGADSSSIVQTMSALVQRDGDVVDAVTGEPLVVTSLPISGAYISVKHRNHLGAMIAQPVSFNRGPVTVDFTTMVDADLYNQTGYDDLEMTTVSGKRALWAGNANGDTKVKYDGTFNDRIVTSSEIWQHPANAFSALNYDNAIGYYQGDVSMDGKTKYDGVFNDRVLIQNNVLLYPLNTALLNNFNQMIEQLP